MEFTKSGFATSASGKDGSEPGGDRLEIYPEPANRIATCTLGPLHTARRYTRPPSPKVAQTKSARLFYLFPQLTLGLKPLIVVLKTLAVRTNDECYDKATRFEAKSSAITFVIGLVTEIPMEFHLPFLSRQGVQICEFVGLGFSQLDW